MEKFAGPTEHNSCWRFFFDGGDDREFELGGEGEEGTFVYF